MTRKIRILIADDHAIVREGLRGLIAGEPDMELVAEAADGLVALQLARALQPDVILLDLLMPRQDGLTTLRQIKQENPAARILILTSFAEDERALAAINNGALGYLLKDAATEELLRAIRDVAQGRASLSSPLAVKVVRELSQPPADFPAPTKRLTRRELELLGLLAHGLTNQDIAGRLSISENTVARHINSILGKLNLANRTQAALYALRQGLARLDEGEGG
jgi:NarL family two-component system response regulator LiaR